MCGVGPVELTCVTIRNLLAVLPSNARSTGTSLGGVPTRDPGGEPAEVAWVTRTGRDLGRSSVVQSIALLLCCFARFEESVGEKRGSQWRAEGRGGGRWRAEHEWRQFGLERPVNGCDMNTHF